MILYSIVREFIDCVLLKVEYVLYFSWDEFRLSRNIKLLINSRMIFCVVRFMFCIFFVGSIGKVMEF